MMTNTLKTLPNGKDYKPEFTSQQLDEALYSLWAMMDTYWFEWYVTHDTARAIRDKKPLYGNKITGAIHKRHINDTFKSTMKRYLDQWKKSPATGDKGTIDARIDDYAWGDKGISFSYKGVPVELKFIDRRYVFFKNPDIVYYEYSDKQMTDDFRVANPFEGYWKARFIVR
jgi:hypothetical protein